MSKKRKPTARKKKKQPVSMGKYLDEKLAVNYVCLDCEEREAIPPHIVRQMDMMDNRDPTVPPQFRCEACRGEMYPEYYKGVHGYEYRLEDRLMGSKVEDSTQE